MGALLVPEPNQESSVTKSKLNKYGRNPDSVAERMRVSDYDRGTGYTPMFHSMMADWPRLSSGEASGHLLHFVLERSLGRPYRKGEPRPQSTQPQLVRDMAEYCRCDERTIQRLLEDWEKRKIARIVKEGKGVYSIELLYRTWESLPDFSKVVDISTAQDPEPQDEQEDKPKESTRVVLTKEALSIRAGAKSPALKVECGVKSVQVQNDSAFDFRCTAVIQAGRAVVRLIPAQDNETKRSVENNQQFKNNNLTSPPRHSRQPIASGKRPTSSKSPSNPAKKDPRSDGLCKLFDPYMKREGIRILSHDTDATQQCCEAQGSMPLAVIREAFTGGKNPRCDRRLSSPIAVVRFVQEIHANWQTKSKDADGTEERDRLIEQLHLRPFGRHGGTYGAAGYIETCERISTDPDQTQAVQRAAKRLIVVLREGAMG